MLYTCGQRTAKLFLAVVSKSHYGVQPDTFEAVRINVFSMLAELAQLFNEDQLDFLFKKFESSAAKCTSDNKQGMLLLFRLAKVDIQVSLSILANATCLQAFG